MLNGLVCTSAFCQGRALLPVYLWKGDSVLWGTANILTGSYNSPSLPCHGVGLNGETDVSLARINIEVWDKEESVRKMS